MKIKQAQRKIETVATQLEEMDFLMSVTGIVVYLRLMIYSEIGEIGRFDLTFSSP
jgi:hypothetical protein